jgi:hypothetical protein
MRNPLVEEILEAVQRMSEASQRQESLGGLQDHLGLGPTRAPTARGAHAIVVVVRLAIRILRLFRLLLSLFTRGRIRFSRFCRFRRFRRCLKLSLGRLRGRSNAPCRRRRRTRS